MTKNIQEKLNILAKIIKEMPNNSGVYRMLDEKKRVLYVGKAKNLKKRLLSYLSLSKLPNRLQQMILKIDKIEIICTNTEIEALVLELDLIKSLKPIYNIMLKDDKSFPYLSFNNKTHKFPKIAKFRGTPAKNKKIFGPYAKGFDLNKVIDLLRKSFLLRNCTDQEFSRRKHPCLEYQIKRCSAPCVSFISEKDYQKSLNQAFDVLNGKAKFVEKDLKKQMFEMSKKLNFEKATQLRDRIYALSSIIAKQEVSDYNLKDSDVFALKSLDGKVIIEHFLFRGGFNCGNHHYFPKNTELFAENEIMGEFIKQYYKNYNLVKEVITNIEVPETENLKKFFLKKYNHNIEFIFPQKGKKKKILDFALKNAEFHLQEKISTVKKNLKFHKKLQEVFNLKKLPEKIELYDNSHISGSDAIGAMVVTNLQGFQKDQYKKFNIKYAQTNDDYAMLKEVIFRRYSKLEAEDYPDLILIDGGKGQVGAVAEIFYALKINNIPFFGIAKGVERNKGKERFCSKDSDYFFIEDQKLLYYLQNIRDEVHRFAITTHRKKRVKSMSKSELDNILGIGKIKKMSLLSYFGSITKIKKASLEELVKTKGINLKLANKIRNSLSILKQN